MHSPNQYFLLGMIVIVAMFAATFFVVPVQAAADTTVFDDSNTTTFDDSSEVTFSDDNANGLAADDSESNDTDTTANDSADEPSSDNEILDEPILDEVLEDETVSEQDLGVKTPGRFYFIKNAARAIQKTFTFNPIKKAEIELQQASEQLLRAQQLIESGIDEKSQEKIIKAVAKYEKKLEKIRARADKIAERAPEIKEHFMDRLIDKQMKQQKILDKLEDKLPEHAFIKIKEAKERSFEHLGEVMNRVIDNPEEMTLRIMSVMENQEGSEFRGLKHMEFLKGLEEYIPDEAKEAIMNARYQTMERFNEHMYDIPEEIRADKFAQYVGSMNGDPVRHMKILDEMKANEFIPEDIMRKIDEAKDLTIKKFAHRIEQIKDEDIRKRFLRPLARGEMDDLKIMRELEENMDPAIRKEIKQQMDDVHQQSIKRFKEKFADNPEAQATADRFKLLTKKMQANPDPATFEMIQELERNLPPEQKEFIRKMEEEIQSAFADKFAKYDDKFIDRFATNDPRHLKVLRNMKFDLPPEAMRGIETAIAMQVENIERKMEQMEDPEEFFEFRKRIELDEQAMAEMRRYKPMISEDMERFQFEKIEDRFKQFDNPEEMLKYRERFEYRVNMDDEYKDMMFVKQPDFFAEIDRRQLKVMEYKIGEFKNPESIMEYKEHFEEAMEARPELRDKMYSNVPNFMNQIEAKEIYYLKQRMEAGDVEFDFNEIKSSIEARPEFREKFLQDKPEFFNEIEQKIDYRRDWIEGNDDNRAIPSPAGINEDFNRDIQILPTAWQDQTNENLDEFREGQEFEDTTVSCPLYSPPSPQIKLECEKKGGHMKATQSANGCFGPLRCQITSTEVFPSGDDDEPVVGSVDGIPCPQLAPPAPHLIAACETEGGLFRPISFENGCPYELKCVK